MSENELHPRTREQIEAVRQGRSKSIYFWAELSLTQIPEEVNLAGQEIRSVPERIRELANLKRLDLSGNPIEEVPDILGLVLDWDAYLRCRGTYRPRTS